jgi:hypothetical protein
MEAGTAMTGGWTPVGFVVVPGCPLGLALVPPVGGGVVSVGGLVALGGLVMGAWSAAIAWASGKATNMPIAAAVVRIWRIKFPFLLCLDFLFCSL